MQLKYFLGLVSMNLETFLFLIFTCTGLMCSKCGYSSSRYIYSSVGKALEILGISLL